MKFGSRLSEELRGKHGKRSVRPRVGDSVRIVRGEFKGIEGKITKVDSFAGVVNVEGVTHEKLKGGNAPVPIRSSNVVVTALVLEDKLRKRRLEVPA
ncbi:MAG: 50S ribosomal protein L24 [Nitrososphaerota archaeon]|jgi:large subunit ribosomal protein L24|nr:50S ribosomal protein L24 [Nitrososphaerota archaeon]MDG6916652.1 50S ribosomal protein L24 [Nitrososphaerota archaeon]MDG6917837.1 50S ribosomal protein L24 [Nitrososphaerota archaeon]MDG6946360.1 50S ribosomal protein L24 [Nitrososphaerota archaeon]MDG6947873.1 50S ribosomal protein L24 [Nitrososphaerota archaeon]